MYRLMFLIVIALVAFLAGCAAGPAGSPAGPTSLPTAMKPQVSTPAVSGSPAATPAAVAPGGLAPEIATRAVAWLAGQVNVAAKDLRLVAAERAEWTDSCFGLGGPAESCLQAITPGWRIAVEAAGRRYEVRSDESGSVFRLAPQGS